MKRLDKEARESHKKLIKRLLNNERKQYIAKCRARRKVTGNDSYKFPQNVTIKVPELLDLGNESSHKEIERFISSTIEALSTGSRVRLNFDQTSKLHPCGTLMFIAFIDRSLERYPGKLSSNYPKDEIVEQLFQSVGLLERLGNSPRKKITAESVTCWDYLTGVCTDLTEMESLFQKYESEIEEELRSGLFDSVSEAITNAINHAYPKISNNTANPEKKWWMFANKRDNNLEIAVYDIGVGIPSSLRSKPELKEWIISRVGSHRKRDTYLLSVAIESPRTITRLPYRGKGLPEMLEFAQSKGVGGFIIYSERGRYGYDATHKKHVSNDLPYAIKGTLLRWSIPLGV